MSAGRVTRTLAAARYLAALVGGSQRYLLPVLVQLAVLGVLFGGDPGPPPTPWAVSALVSYPIAAWLAVVVANAEDPAQRVITAVAVGGRGALAAATALVALVGDLLLVVPAVLVPLLATRYSYPPDTIVLAVVAHLACAAAGTAVGLVCARPLVHRIGWSFCLAATVVTVTAVQPWLPPVGTAVRALSDAGEPPLVGAVLGVLAVPLAATVGWLVDRRC